MPPQDLVATRNYRLTADCRIIAGPVQILPSNSVPPVSDVDSGTFGSIASAANHQVAPLGSGSGSGWGAYVVQRTWDCCGILLNEYWTEFDWSNCSGGFCSSWIRSYSGQDGGKWHPEYTTYGPGWYPVSSDHSLYISSGGVGYTTVTLRGHQGYGYRGVFDTGGSDYYDSYTQYITGKANATWSCSYSKYWRKSFGFNYQAWCGYGNYGQK
jgi:hypothetical protein